LCSLLSTLANLTINLQLRFYSFLIVPQQYLDEEGNEKVEKTMRANSKRLITHADMYRTIVGEMKEPPDEALSTMRDSTFDIMRSKVPASRSCKDAKIPDKHCACMRKKRGKKKKKA
jgi:hypothetical protein